MGSRHEGREGALICIVGGETSRGLLYIFLIFKCLIYFFVYAVPSTFECNLR